MVCVFSLFIALAVPYVHADSVIATRLVTDSKMCLAKVDLCVMVKKLHIAPIKQVSAGIGALDVACKPDYQLVLKATNNMPSCVKPSDAQELVKRGWALSQDDITKLRMTYEPNTSQQNQN